jgi:hypothetical protein
MSDIVSRLTADLRWRLSAAGKRLKPKRKERASWGAFQIPTAVPLLLWAVYFSVFGLFGMDMMRPYMPEWLHFLLCSWPGWIGSFLLLMGLTRLVNRRAEISAYRKLLTTNERFTLVEYSKYLRRQIERAKVEPGLGGPAEVARLEDTQRKLNELLRSGAGHVPAVDSPLSAEADLAEAVVQAYEEAGADPLEELDARLPAELRTRIEELEGGPGEQPSAERES